MCASPQLENGHTRIANELLEKLAEFTYPSASPLKIILIVYRQCYGYQKKENYFSLSYLQKKTKLTRPTIVHWLDWLVKSLLLVKGIQPTKNGYLYKINKDYEQWNWVVKPLKLVKARPYTSKTPLTATSKTPLTHKRKKENTKESDFFNYEVNRLKEWNSNQTSPIRNFKAENIVNKHSTEKVKKLREKYGAKDDGFSKFLTALNEF